jgi:hypothetical protein
MDSMPAELWIDPVAHRLHRQWRTVDPEQLEDVAAGLWRDPRLHVMTPAEAVTYWLRPVASDPQQHGNSTNGARLSDGERH